MRILLLFLLIILSITVFSQRKAPINLMGTWEGIDSTKKAGSIFFIFSPDSNFALTLGEDSVRGTYKLDTTTSIRIVVITIPGSDAPRIMRNMIKFSGDSLKMQTAPDTGPLVWIEPENYVNTGVFVRRTK